MGWTEVPLEELIERYGHKVESEDVPVKKSKTETPSDPDVPVPSFAPAVIEASEFSNLPIRQLIDSAGKFSKKRLSILWNLDHHRLLLKRLDQIWEHMNDDEKKSILALLKKRIAKSEVDQIDEIVKGSKWARLLTASK